MSRKRRRKRGTGVSQEPTRNRPAGIRRGTLVSINGQDFRVSGWADGQDVLLLEREGRAPRAEGNGNGHRPMRMPDDPGVERIPPDVDHRSPRFRKGPRED